MTRKTNKNRNNQRSTKALSTVATTPENNSHLLRKISTVQQYSGPLPPPEILTKYNEAVDNGAERIMVMAEKQQDHRMNLEKFVISQDSKKSLLGLWLGFFLVIICVFGGWYLLYLDKNISGYSLIFISLGSLVTVFVVTQKSRKEEREARNTTSTEKSISNK